MTDRFFNRDKPVKFKGSKAEPGELAFRYYDPNKKVLGKRMGGLLPLRRRRTGIPSPWPGGDPFGGETFNRPWMHTVDSMEGARQKADVAFEMFQLLGVPFFCFHDRDIAPEGATLAESNRNVREIGEIFAEKMAKTGVKAPLGHRQHVLQPPFHGGRRHQP